MKKCQMCNTTLRDEDIECPSCHFKLKSTNNIHFMTKGLKGFFVFTIGFFIIMFIFVIGMFIKTSKNRTELFNRNSGTKNETYYKNVALLDGASIIKDGFYYIDGNLKNNNNVDLNGIKVTFTIYDEKGALLDTVYETVDLIEANGTWHFKISCRGKEPSSFKLKKIESN